MTLTAAASTEHTTNISLSECHTTLLYQYCYNCPTQAYVFISYLWSVLSTCQFLSRSLQARSDPHQYPNEDLGGLLKQDVHRPDAFPVAQQTNSAAAPKGNTYVLV